MEVTENTLFQVEKTFLTTLVTLLEKRRITHDDAKKITTEFLALRPFVSMEDMKKKLATFTSSYPDFLLSSIVFLQQEDSQNSQRIITQMLELIKNNRIDEALLLINPLWKTNNPQPQKSE